MRIRYLPMLLFLFLLSCKTSIDPPTPENVMGYVPVYASSSTEFKKIISEAPRASMNGGKMYTEGHLLYQVEPDSGIHVINYSNPAQPQKLGFIKSFLCKEVSVKNGIIYTNNLSDLVVIDASNMSNVREIGRVAKVFPDLDNQFPPRHTSETVYFECPDPKKGAVIAWTWQSIHNPKCWR